MYCMSFLWPWPKVTAVALINKKFACLHDKVWTSQPIITKLGSYIPLVMLITRLDFAGILLESFFAKFSDVFFQGQTLFDISQELMVVPMVVKQKGGASVGYAVSYMTSSFDPTPDLWFFKVKFQNNCFSGIVFMTDVKHKENKWVTYWADCMFLPFGHTHVDVSR